MTRPRLPVTGAWFRTKRNAARLPTTDPRITSIIAQATLSRFERGSGRIELYDAAELCDLYGVELGQLLDMIRAELAGKFP